MLWAADCLDRASGLRFSQYPNDLFLAESTSLHVLLLLSSRTSLMSRPPFGGQAMMLRPGGVFSVAPVTRGVHHQASAHRKAILVEKICEHQLSKSRWHSLRWSWSLTMTVRFAGGSFCAPNLATRSKNFSASNSIVSSLFTETSNVSDNFRIISDRYLSILDDA